jgi:DNA-binding SARP family transcriptional activator
MPLNTARPAQVQATPSPSTILTISCFGTLELRRGGRLLPPFPTRCSKLLFAYLILHRGRPQSRDVILGTLWGDEPEAAARKHLRTELWRLRGILEPPGIPRKTFLAVDSGEITLSRTGGWWLDVGEFEHLAGAGLAAGDRLDSAGSASLREAVELYRGDFLEGIYETWALAERARLKSLYLDVLERLMRFYATCRNWSAAIAYGERLLRADPFLEHIHRELMRLHYVRGDRPAALRQYRACTEFLRDELAVEPMPETLRLFQQIVSGEHRRAHTPSPWMGAPAGGDASESRDGLETSLRRRRDDPLP